jgi:serine/threonine protein phosphatase PrpC
VSKSETWTKSRIPLKRVEGFQIQGGVPVQEDYFEVNPQRGIFILADGFGGSAGQEAAQIVVKAVRRFLEQEAGDLDATLPFELRSYYSLAGNVLFNAIAYANQVLLGANQGRSPMKSGGASVVAGYLEGRLLALANAGACTVSLYREGRTKEVLVPRSLAKQMSPFAEAGSEGATVPLMSLGTARQMEPEIVEIEVRPGDQLTFQSSGVRARFRDQLFALNATTPLSQIVDAETHEGNLEYNSSVIWLVF